jgi:hypothetical protein
MPLRLVPALALLAGIVPFATVRAEDTAPPSTTTTTTTTTTAPAAVPPRAAEHRSVEVAEADYRLRVLDIRLSFGGQHGPTRVHDDYESGAGSMNPTGGYDYEIRRGQHDGRNSSGGIFDLQFDMGKIRDWGGLVWGAGLRGVGHTLDLKATTAVPQTQELTYSTFGLIGHIDYAYAFTHNWHVEVGPFLSFGGASMDWFDQDAGGVYRSDTASGGYIQGGLRLGTYAAFWRHLVVGGSLEYSSTYARMDVDHSATDAKSKLTVREHGFGALLTAGFRF